jgi:hypothetical protein
MHPSRAQGMSWTALLNQETKAVEGRHLQEHIFDKRRSRLAAGTIVRASLDRVPSRSHLSSVLTVACTVRLVVRYCCARHSCPSPLCTSGCACFVRCSPRCVPSHPCPSPLCVLLLLHTSFTSSRAHLLVITSSLLDVARPLPLCTLLTSSRT